MRSRRNLPNDQHTTERVLSDLGAHELEGKFDIGGLLILNPLVQVACGENNVVQKPLALREVRLEPRLVQVLLTGLEDELLVILNAARKLVTSIINEQFAGTHAQ
jgi:hypothetical protein